MLWLPTPAVSIWLFGIWMIIYAQQLFTKCVCLVFVAMLVAYSEFIRTFFFFFAEHSCSLCLETMLKKRIQKGTWLNDPPCDSLKVHHCERHNIRPDEHIDRCSLQSCGITVTYLTKKQRKKQRRWMQYTINNAGLTKSQWVGIR